MRVTMIGAGYVGLVSGACFADFGHQVTCIDKDAAKVAALNRGEIPIFEPGLTALVEANMRQGRLEFALDASRIGDAEAVFIAVGTPSRRGDGHDCHCFCEILGLAKRFAQCRRTRLRKFGAAAIDLRDFFGRRRRAEPRTQEAHMQSTLTRAQS